MKRSLLLVVVFALLLGGACGSMNRVTPAGADKTVMEADIRGKIAEAVPSKTFAVDVTVGNGGVVTLSGHAKNEDDRRAIAKAANSVHGVNSVINNITIQP
jgi:osmotically-inducible protein OsmY